MTPPKPPGWTIFTLPKGFFKVVLLKYWLFQCHLATALFLEQERYMFNPTSPPTGLPLETRKTMS